MSLRKRDNLRTAEHEVQEKLDGGGGGTTEQNLPPRTESMQAR